MQVLVTGAAGFIGQHLVHRLAGDGFRVVCLDRNSHAMQRLVAPGVNAVAGDVTDPPTVVRCMADCDAVVHLAAVYSFWEPDPSIYTKVNTDGTRNVMECALDSGVSKVVHLSTSLVYGKPVDCPFNESSAPGPVRFSEYARTKYAGDQVSWQLHANSGLPLVVLYPGSVLGKGDNGTTGRHIRGLLERRIPVAALQDCVITFVHVRDVVEAIVSVLVKRETIGQRYLVGKHRLSVRAANKIVQDIAGVPLPRVALPDAAVTLAAALLTRWADHTRRPPPWGLSADQVRTMRAGLKFDGSKAERELGITCTPLRTAIEEMIAACRE